MQRHYFFHNGLRFSYLDAGGDGKPLIALHSHWMEGLTFLPLATALAPEWRVVALDQRGHGYSDHAPSYTREDYLGDLGALLEHLGVERAVMMGNSLGGVNAWQFAARHPKQVSALVIEDIGAEPGDDTSFALPWGGFFPRRETLEERVGPRFLPYLEDSFRETPSGWTLAFDPRDTAESQKQLNGNHWADWLATDCPALLIRGSESRVTSAELLEQMAARRRNTKLITLAGGHVVHMDNPSRFAEVLREFLGSL